MSRQSRALTFNPHPTSRRPHYCTGVTRATLRRTRREIYDVVGADALGEALTRFPLEYRRFIMRTGRRGPTWK